MKAELINTFQMFFILVFLVGVISYTITAIRNSIIKADYSCIRRIYSKTLNYSRFMVIENYVSYEKYKIWRYCVHF
jgi:hypothetical protein